MNSIRLAYQWLLSQIAINGGWNDQLSQYCDRCGRTNFISFWAYDVRTWEAVMGNVNGHHHGCVCVPCFTIIALDKGIHVDWEPHLFKR